MRPWPVLALVLLCIGAGLFAGCGRGVETSAYRGLGSVGRMNHALRGEIYILPHGADRLPNFSGLKPAGVIYVQVLDVPEQDWRAGFPGVTGRAEWFAIDYKGVFLARTPGPYRFSLVSDDGSRLIIDGKTVVDNDGVHGVITRSGEAILGVGAHTLEAQYFQGPRDRLALQLRCQGPGGREALFPACGLEVRTPGLWRLWLWWVAALAGLGATVIWMTRRRIAREARGVS